MNKYFKAKEELWKLKNFTMQKYNLQKNPLKETKTFQNIVTLLLGNLTFQHKPKYIIFQKSSYKNRPINLGPKAFKLLYSIVNLNTLSLPW
jgi:hypothetical protein